jgi:hypothetical protein
MVDKISYEFDPFELMGLPTPSSNVRLAKQELCEFILEEVLSHVGDGKSPVSGGKWKRSLSKDYKKKKSEISSSLFANMELQGDMLDSLECVINRAGNLELRIKGREAAKADGHNNHSGKSKLPPREFIPKPNQTFKRDIISGMRDIAEEFLDGQ